MANWAAIALVGTAISAVGLADYTDQSRMAGVGLGEIGLLDYAGQFGLPNAAHRAELEPPSAVDTHAPRAFLPDAPEGWVRRHWSEGDNSWLHKDRMLNAEDSPEDGTMLDSAIAVFMDHRDIYAQRRAFSSGWIYERGEDIIFIGAEKLDKGSSNSLVGRGVSKVNALLNRMNFREGYTVVHGVPYAESMHISEHQRLFRSFQGRIGYGQEMRIRVRAHANNDAVEALLGEIDHAGLNKLLDIPVAGVGPQAPRVPAPDAKLLAGYTFEVRDALRDLSNRAVKDVLGQARPIDLALDGMGLAVTSFAGEQLSQVQSQ